MCEIGRGGMGIIYKGIDHKQSDPDKAAVAIKLLVSDAANDPVMRNRFVNEAKAAKGHEPPKYRLCARVQRYT